MKRVIVGLLALALAAFGGQAAKAEALLNERLWSEPI